MKTSIQPPSSSNNEIVQDYVNGVLERLRVDISGFGIKQEDINKSFESLLLLIAACEEKQDKSNMPIRYNYTKIKQHINQQWMAINETLTTKAK